MNLEDFLPPDHVARFVWRVVERRDLLDLLGTYSRDLGGRPALDPKGLLAVILYGHAVGTASPRQRRRCRGSMVSRGLKQAYPGNITLEKDRKQRRRKDRKAPRGRKLKDQTF